MLSMLSTPPLTPVRGQGHQANPARRTGCGINLATPNTPKRFRRLCKDGIQGISKQSIRKIARRGGIKRIQPSIYDTTKEVIVKRIRDVMGRVTKIVENCNRKTVNTLDIVMALKDMPEPLPIYGFGWPVKEFPDKRTRTHTVANESERACVLEIERSAAAATANTSTSTPETRAASHSESMGGVTIYSWFERQRETLNISDDEDDEINDADDEDDSEEKEEEEPWDYEAERKAYEMQREDKERVAQWEIRMAARKALIEEMRRAELAELQQE